MAGAQQSLSSVHVGAAEPVSPASWYGEGVRPTEPQSPDDERAGFHLPAGFEVRLFAAEPEIAKPMNMAFDDRGRMWVTDSFEYPYPVRDSKTPTDSVRILEDTDGDGRADRSTVFADGLNIPIGVLPYGEGCLCFSIPNIYYLRDTDGDDVCDQRDIVLGPFDTTRDTHGMVNSLRMGDDGWIYANHGFNNQSTVAGADGHKIVMHSGNTFRFRPDGSRVEHVTWGQVNPFGRTHDDWGNDFTADCHSKPISELVRGGHYPSFGKPDDGLGMIPPMMDHLHGSTAISGLVFVPESLGKAALADHMLSGNVMTSRINRNAVTYDGATAVAHELPDFLTSDDPWFRPVDIQLGPDGCLYVADFYNRIIGHYEVPLDHPGRDRHRGRIWQIRSLNAPPEKLATLSAPAEIARAWNAANPSVRRLALQHAIEHATDALDDEAKEIIRSSGDASQRARISATWYLQQRELLDADLLKQLTGDPAAMVRTHGCRAMSDLLAPRSAVSSQLDVAAMFDIAVAKLGDDNAHVRCAAAAALGRSHRSEAIVPLLETLAQVGANDPIQRQTIRIALRDIIQSQDDFDSSLRGLTESMTNDQKRELAEIALAVTTPVAADLLVMHLSENDLGTSESLPMMQHIIEQASPDRADDVVDLAKQISADQPGVQHTLADALLDACGKRGEGVPSRLRAWLDELIQLDIDQVKSRLRQGQPLAIMWHDDSGEAWPSQIRQNADSGKPLSMLSSFPLGETHTGQLVSSPFECPTEISFRIAGHNRRPDVEDSHLNRFELVDANTGQVLHRAFPPRDDAAVLIKWDCQAAQGTSVILRCIDGDVGTAYAWIAVGAFQPAWLWETDDSLDRILTMLVRYRMLDQRADLLELLALLSKDRHNRTRVAAAIAELDGHQPLARLLQRALELGVDLPLVDDWISLAAGGETLDELEHTAKFAKHLTAAQQTLLAISLASDIQTVPILIQLIEDGSLAPDVLQEKTVWEPMQTIADANLMARAEVIRLKAKPFDAAREQAINRMGDRLIDFRGDSELGRTLFTKHCAVCHQLAGQGELVGPQLDGVGSRNVQRLLEDITVPDRNVDRAFRTSTFLTEDGAVINGLIRDENDARVLVVTPDGKVQNLPLSEIELRREATTSLMPSNLHQTLGEDAIVEIVQYLRNAASQN